VVELLGADQTGVIYLADSWLETLMRRDIEVSDAFVVHVLGPILDLPHHEGERLLDTLGAFVDCAGSINQVAATKFLHRNTVRKRLDRIEALSGRSLSAPAQTAELVLALAWLRARLPDASAAPAVPDGAPTR
jgi:DNA-binding PucR family transcriptional regulator